MTTGNFLKVSFVLAFIVCLAAATATIMHYAAAEILLWIALLAWLPFITTAIVEVIQSEYITAKEKLVWSFGVCVAPVILGLFYLSIRRKRITDYEA